MARIARVTLIDSPHHVIQRGNRRQNVFFSKDDKQSYLDILYEQSKRFSLGIWAYCLMDNHVHLIVVPRTPESLSRTDQVTWGDRLMRKPVEDKVERDVKNIEERVII